MLKRNKPPKVATIIGQGTEIIGDVRFSGGLHLDGKIVGNVSGEEGSSSAITVSEHGAIEGDLRVDSLVLNGEVVGDVYGGESVELASKARVTGTVYYCMLEMAMGAEVNGQLVHTESQEQRRLEYDGKNDEASDDEA
jgi:cytoskeletal protein CcmA (bactofilin family)